jgi:hypothetical protein
MPTLNIADYVRKIETKATQHELRYRRLGAVLLRSDALAIATLEVLDDLSKDQREDEQKVGNAAGESFFGQLLNVGNAALNGGAYLGVLTAGKRLVDEQRRLEASF